MNLGKLKPVKGDYINVIIETPKSSTCKYAYDPELKLFRLKKTLPTGMVFPFDFGFIPNTVGGDGDPLDVLVIMEHSTFTGCLVECRTIGVLKAVQKDKSGKETRNDRIIAVCDSSLMHGDIESIDNLNKSFVSEAEQFFINYNKQEGNSFQPIRWAGPKVARSLVTEAIRS